MPSAGRSALPWQAGGSGWHVLRARVPGITAWITDGAWETKGTPEQQVCKVQAMPPAPSGARNQNAPHLLGCRVLDI